jgi:hypothetical protein
MVIIKQGMNRESATERERRRNRCEIVVTRQDSASAVMATIRVFFGKKLKETRGLGMFADQVSKTEREATTQQRRSAQCISCAKKRRRDAAKPVAAKRERAAAGGDHSRRRPLQMGMGGARLQCDNAIVGTNPVRTARSARSAQPPVPLMHARQHAAPADSYWRSCGISAVRSYLKLATHHALERAGISTGVPNRDHGNSTAQSAVHRWNALCSARNARASEERRKRPAKLTLGERAIVVPAPLHRETRASVRMENQAQTRRRWAKRDLQRFARDCEGQIAAKRVELLPLDPKGNRHCSLGDSRGSSVRIAHRLPIRSTHPRCREFLCGDWR